MDATLTPHRSLSKFAFRALMTFVIAMNVAVGTYFVSQGAYPVVGFLGLDVAAVWLAFHLNYRAARQAEHVRVGPDHVHLERRSPRGVDHWVVSPLWARVSLGASAVRIASAGSALSVGAFLSPKERREFALALDAALFRARRGDHSASTSDMS